MQTAKRIKFQAGILALIVLSFLAAQKASAAVVFETNFDSNADWNTDGSKEGECSVIGQSNSANICDSGNYPDNWEAYRSVAAYGGAHSPASISRPPGSLADHTGTGSGKAAIIYNESYPAYPVSSWPGDGILAKYFSGTGYQELYVQLWMRTQPGYQMVENGVMKFFRVGHWKGLSSSQQNLFYTPDQLPGLISEPCYHSSQWGYLTAYRCDPNDFYCTSQNNAYQKNDTQIAGGGNWGDGNWHRWVFHVKINSVGSYNGIYEESMDGVTKVSRSDVMLRKSGSTAGNWNDVMFGGNSDNPYTTQDDQWYAIDDITISTSPIPADYVPGGTYVDTTAPTSTASPAAGTYSTTQNVTLSADETATIYYTTDGSTPTTSSATYSSPISISSTKTLKYFAKDTAGNVETPTHEDLYMIDATVLNVGETTVLGTIESAQLNSQAAMVSQSITLAQAKTIQSLSIYAANAAGNVRMGIYDATGPSGGPGALKASTGEATVVLGWNTVSVTTPVQLSAGTYWIAFIASNPGFDIADTASGTFKYYLHAYGALPATFSTTPDTGTLKVSFYATFNDVGSLDITPPAAPTGLSVM